MKTILSLMLLLSSTSARAIQVPLRAGMLHVTVIEAVKDSLGIDHRFFDPATGILRPYNVTDGIEFVLPENAPPDTLRFLRKIIADLRDGMVVDDLTDLSQRRSIEFGVVPVIIIEPAVIAPEPRRHSTIHTDYCGPRFWGGANVI